MLLIEKIESYLTSPKHGLIILTQDELQILVAVAQEARDLIAIYGNDQIGQGSNWDYPVPNLKELGKLVKVLQQEEEEE